MKNHILIHSIAALLVALPTSHAEEKKPDEKKDAQKNEQKHSTSTVVSSADGTATITIDINGKQETRTFKLGDWTNTIPLKTPGGDVKLGFSGAPNQKPGAKERLKGPWLGVAMEPVQDVVRAQLSLAPGEGVVINHVSPDGPAAKAGLEPNDILLRFEDQIIVEPSQLRKLIAMKKTDQNVKLTFLRKGERKEATVTLIEHEIEPGDGGRPQWLPGVQNGFDVPGLPGVKLRVEQLQDQLRQMKEKHPGVIVGKREWMSGSPEQMLKGQVEKLKQNLKNSDIPKEAAENIIRNLEHMNRETSEALERTKRNADEIIKNAQRAVEEAAKAIGGARKAHEGEPANPRENEQGENLKKPGESL